MTASSSATLGLLSYGFVHAREVADICLRVRNVAEHRGSEKVIAAIDEAWGYRVSRGDHFWLWRKACSVHLERATMARRPLLRRCGSLSAGLVPNDEFSQIANVRTLLASDDGLKRQMGIPAQCPGLVCVPQHRLMVESSTLLSLLAPSPRHIERFLNDNRLTTLPDGIFQDLAALSML